jgi:hypothetical protein
MIFSGIVAGIVAGNVTGNDAENVSFCQEIFLDFF